MDNTYVRMDWKYVHIATKYIEYIHMKPYNTITKIYGAQWEEQYNFLWFNMVSAVVLSIIGWTSIPVFSFTMKPIKTGHLWAKTF